MKSTCITAFCLMWALLQPASGQEKTFNWVPANDETVRLDPAFYHNGRTYHPGPDGGNMHVDIDAQQPVTVAMATADEWSRVTQHAEGVEHISYLCMQQHVVRSTYTCHLPGGRPMVLVVHDERGSTRAAILELGEVLTHEVPEARLAEHAVAGIGAVFSSHSSHKFVSPNDVHIQYYSWSCIENCIQPEYQWMIQVKEKYEVTGILKVYGGITPDHDGEQVNIKIKSPVPMAVGILPARIAGQLYGKPEMFESAMESSPCQQRGVQNSTFQCVINLADGPQALVLLPESSSKIPSHKKAEVEMQAVKCVANCELLANQKEQISEK